MVLIIFFEGIDPDQKIKFGTDTKQDNNEKSFTIDSFLENQLGLSQVFFQTLRTVVTIPIEKIIEKDNHLQTVINYLKRLDQKIKNSSLSDIQLRVSELRQYACLQFANPQLNCQELASDYLMKSEFLELMFFIQKLRQCENQ